MLSVRINIISVGWCFIIIFREYTVFSILLYWLLSRFCFTISIISVSTETIKDIVLRRTKEVVSRNLAEIFIINLKMVFYLRILLKTNKPIQLSILSNKIHKKIHLISFSVFRMLSNTLCGCIKTVGVY